MKRSRRGLWALLLIVPCLLVALVLAALSQPTEPTYGFVGIDHPADMWRSGTDRWAYFGPNGFGTSAAMAAKARRSLLPVGFVEDKTQRPWYRFVKGTEEVVVCDSSEYGVRPDAHGGRTLVHNDAPTASHNYAVVLVKNGPGSHASPAVFRVKKTLLGW